jgi:hypothetical protein
MAIVADLSSVDVVVPAQRVEPTDQRDRCRYCGTVDCPDRIDHDRLHRGNETTWRGQAS